MFSSHPINKGVANENFKHTVWQARRDAFLSKLFGKSTCLKRYEDIRTDVAQQERYLGVMEIPIDKITGTVGRQEDFDGRFRPLKNHLQERWVNIALLANRTGWPAIEVFKVGDEYFVLDGHHRTSYARITGMAFIDAAVWEVEQEPTIPPPASVVAVSREFYSQKDLADKIVIYDAMACCCG